MSSKFNSVKTKVLTISKLQVSYTVLKLENFHLSEVDGPSKYVYISSKLVIT